LATRYQDLARENLIVYCCNLPAGMTAHSSSRILAIYPATSAWTISITIYWSLLVYRKSGPRIYQGLWTRKRKILPNSTDIYWLLISGNVSVHPFSYQKIDPVDHFEVTVWVPVTLSNPIFNSP
jgi:hypothetical protein